MKSRNQHIDETDFLVVDVETTGLSPDGGDRVCEIGAVKIRGGAVIESFGSLINPERPISAGAYAVNRISPAMVEDAPRFSDVAEKIRTLMEHSVLVAYNAPFDVSFLNSELRLGGHPLIKNTVVDALALARQLLPGLGRYPQANVAQVVGIAFPVKHRALEDVMVTAKIFTLFVSIMKANNLDTVADLNRSDLKHVLHARRLEIVKESMSNGANLWIKYLSPANAEITDRIVTPKDLIVLNSSRNESTHLLAYCHSSQGERNFHIDRILDLRSVNSSTI
jgi:DNA polymerase III epsilon subunit family exonuclease